MNNQENTYTQIASLVQRFKALTPAARKGMNENATRQGYILPLFRALDEEIDARVYWLYGLTEEEIKVVEGR
jgi:hypothetical protein